MESDEKQDLLTDYAFNLLDEANRALVENWANTNPQVRAELDAVLEVTDSLALSVTPVELPAGSLGRLQAKVRALSENQPTVVAQKSATPAKPLRFPTAGRAGQAMAAFQTGSQTGATVLGRKAAFTGGMAAALAACTVLFVTTAVFGWLWWQTETDRNQLEQSNQAVLKVLADPNLKVSQLKSTNANNSGETGSLQLYAAPGSEKAYLVAQNLPLLPSDKEYEVWLIKDSQANRAGLLGRGGTAKPMVYTISAQSLINQYQTVAVTVEVKGGVDKATSSPILAGPLSLVGA